MSKDNRIVALEDSLHGRRVENDGLRQELHAAKERLRAMQISMDERAITDADKLIEAEHERDEFRAELIEFRAALSELVDRCDRTELADGSSLDTRAASALLYRMADEAEQGDDPLDTRYYPSVEGEAE